MLGRYLILGAVALTLSVGVSGCSSIDYVYNDTLVKKGLVSEELVLKDKEEAKDKFFYVPKQLGGIKIKDSSAEGGERLFILKRENSSVLAETQIYKTDKNKYFDRAYFTMGGSLSNHIGMEFRFEDDSNKLFEKAYFNVGINKKKERVGIELRFVY